jgi:hypothetical protein
VLGLGFVFRDIPLLLSLLCHYTIADSVIFFATKPTFYIVDLLFSQSSRNFLQADSVIGLYPELPCYPFLFVRRLWLYPSCDGLLPEAPKRYYYEGCFNLTAIFTNSLHFDFTES